jgi:hypothetical protein
MKPEEIEHDCQYKGIDITADFGRIFTVADPRDDHTLVCFFSLAAAKLWIEQILEAH